VYQVCTKCGNFNNEYATECYACRAPLQQVEEPEPVGVPAVEPDWRREVAERLESYRARQRAMRPNAEQEPLRFAGEEAEPAADDHAPTRTSRQESRQTGIVVEEGHPRLGFDIFDDARAHLRADVVPVAEVRRRALAGLLDGLFLLLAYAAFLAIFRATGGEFPLGKVGSAIYAVTFFLFYAQYFVLFTLLGGATPGMRLRGLYPVAFDGSPPTRRQLAWRSFGYLLSAATLLLGFLWALWDEDGLTWQDLISETYLTTGALRESPSEHAAALH